MNRALKFIIVFVGFGFVSSAQTVNYMEYFINTDPGYGNGTSVAITANDSVSVIIPIDISSYSKGFHTLYARVKDNSGRWSTTTAMKFYFLPRSTFNPIITQAEYFIDTEPGLGLGMPITITPNDSVGALIPIDISSFSEGFHTIYTRVKDEIGRWSTTTAKKFYFLPRTTFAPIITHAEYFIDAEPGLGSGIPISISPKDSIGAIIPIDISLFTEGFHTIYTRVKDDLGRWSTTTSRKFYFLPRTSFDPIITYAEYFLDNDPGLGAGTPIAITPNDSVGALIPLDISTFAAGFHTIYSRVKDDIGRWSTTTARKFYFLPRNTFAPTITQAEYFLDSDPGIGMATPLTITPNDSVSNLFPVDISSLTAGFHSMNIRVKDDNGRWSLLASRQFYHDPLFKSTGNITYMEYYVDIDPGYGNSISIPITPNDSIMSNFTLDLGYLTAGNHYLNVRTKDSYGRWSHVAFDLIKFGTPVYLKAGWNIISASVLPENTDMKVIVDQLITDGKLVKVQDELGNAVEYVASSWVNNIPAFDNNQGYKIKVNADCSFDIIGQQILPPVNIPLSTGWNIAGYPYGDTLKALSVFSEIIGNGSLSKVQSETGAAIEYLDGIGWVDNIKNAIQGEGYMVRMNFPGSITFGTKQGLSAFVPYSIPETVFQPTWIGKGYSHMNIYISNASINGSDLENGDQIGVFDGDRCVGIYTYTRADKYPLNLKASLDDPVTRELDGFKQGNRMLLKVWSNKYHDFCSEVNIMPSNGYSDLFVASGTTVINLDAKLISTGITDVSIDNQVDIYPNPAASNVNIKFFVNHLSPVHIAVYDLIGNLREVVTNQYFTDGSHNIEWDRIGANLPDGIYIIKIKTDDYVLSRSIVFLKQ